MCLDVKAADCGQTRPALSLAPPMNLMSTEVGAGWEKWRDGGGRRAPEHEPRWFPSFSAQQDVALTPEF